MEYVMIFTVPIFSLLFSRKIKNIILRNLSVAAINLVVSYILYWSLYWINKSDKAEYDSFEIAGIGIFYLQLMLICLLYYLIYKLTIWWIYKPK